MTSVEVSAALDALHRERRLLVFTPTGRDASLAQAVLGEQGVRSAVCSDLGDLIEGIAAGAGAVLVSEEALADPSNLQMLAKRLARQPPWSDLPILMLTHPGANSIAVRQASRALGNVTLIERPVRVAALVTAVQTALRARERQYVAREHLAELDEAATALRLSEGRLKAMFDNAAVGIAELTARGRFALVNDAFCRLVGVNREGLSAMSLADVAHADERNALAALLRAVVGGVLEHIAADKRLIRNDGRTIWARLTLSSVPAVEGREPHIVAVVEDVTERVEAEEDLREADRRKDEFLATLAHELRNPLAPIRNSLHIFRLVGTQDATLEGVTEMMERQVAHMVRMVDDLLEVARISRGKIELRREPVELAAVLRSAMDTSRPHIEGAQHHLRVEIPPETIMLDADPVRLAQVFSNLLNNSAKYTPRGGEIAILAAVEDGTAVVRVTDTGEGIPEGMLGRVFNMFTQVNAGARAQGGLGIGLTLARTLVQLHGGTIEAFSEGPGRGSEFVVRLPLARHLEPGQRRERLSPLPPGSQLRRVLVVDDNRDAADSLGVLLQFLGAEVRVVHDGEEALEAVHEFRPAVVLLDLGMPGMNGFDVARRLRGDPSAADLTLVALTGWGQREDRRRTSEAGFDYHLVKPADVGILQSILSKREHDQPPPVKH